jgi:hypothetical protein
MLAVKMAAPNRETSVRVHPAIATGLPTSVTTRRSARLRSEKSVGKQAAMSMLPSG